MFFRSLILVSFLLVSIVSNAAWQKKSAPRNDYNAPLADLASRSLFVQRNREAGPFRRALCARISSYRVISLLWQDRCPAWNDFMNIIYGSVEGDVPFDPFWNDKLANVALGGFGIASSSFSFFSENNNNEFGIEARYGARQFHPAIGVDEIFSLASVFTVTINFVDSRGKSGNHAIVINRLMENGTPYYLLADSNLGVYQMDDYWEFPSLLAQEYSVSPYSNVKVKNIAAHWTSLTSPIPDFLPGNRFHPDLGHPLAFYLYSLIQTGLDSNQWWLNQSAVPSPQSCYPEAVNGLSPTDKRTFPEKSQWVAYGWHRIKTSDE